MSTTEEKLQKMKVTELKELLAKHTLVQSGKKDDLIKRLLDNNVSLDGDGQEPEEELTEPAPEPTTGESSTTTTDQNKPSSSDKPTASTSEQPTLTPEQQAMKARAERFGVPFNPNPTPTNKTKSAPSTEAAKATPAAATPETKTKSGPIDKANLGIPDETLAKRAARFGLPEKKADAPSEKKAAPASKAAAAPAAEATPEQAAKIAEDEEKKRKRAEKFGSVATKPESNGEEPDAKKVKV